MHLEVLHDTETKDVRLLSANHTIALQELPDTRPGQKSGPPQKAARYKTRSKRNCRMRRRTVAYMAGVTRPV
jgi:hypothetical protein